MEGIIFWSFLLITAFLTLTSLYKKTFDRHNVIWTCLFMWVVIYYFHSHHGISRYHMIWAMPAAIVVEFTIAIMIERRHKHRH